MKHFFGGFIILLLWAMSCKKDNDTSFISNFHSSSPRSWIGPEFWSNPLQDWQVAEGKLHCLVSGPYRNVHVLTRRIDSVAGDLNTKVWMKMNHQDTSSHLHNWMGFSLGARGEFEDYRDDAVFGKGWNIGVTTKGIPFIGEIPKDVGTDQYMVQSLLKGVVLQVNIHDQDVQLTLSMDNGEILKKISASNTRTDTLHGDLVLVSHYDHRNRHPDFNRSSVIFKDWNISGSKMINTKDHAFGPILFTQYTLSRGNLKITAQMAPVNVDQEKVKFQINQGGVWNTLSESAIDPDARTATFAFKNWDITKDIPYRIAYHLNDYNNTFYWEGNIRKEPLDQKEIVVAGFTGNNDLGFPNNDITDQIVYHDPDILFFSGDQIYESVGGYGAQRSPIDKATLDYLRKWYLYGWAYRDLMKDRPTIAIPDDHDVYHGNIWGAGGRDIPEELGQGAKAQGYGGYKMSPEWVNMVQRTQTSHLPDPYDTTPVDQNISVYYTDMVYGGISLAIIEDRKFKSAPKALLPDAEIWNGWPQNRNFDIKSRGDIEGAVLLGQRQLNFLDHWASDWSYHAEMKMLLSQTIFANVATIPEEAMSGAIIPTLRVMTKGDYAPNDRRVTDLDSNGWPQTGRNKAIKTIRKGFAFHLAGDQHLGSTIQYGVEDHNDSGYALCVPSISNFWPRRWYPKEGGKNRKPDMPKYTGEFEDGFGNKMTVHAVSNPHYTGKTPAKLYDRAAGYGIVRLNKSTREITIECWPRESEHQRGMTKQYEGWPITIDQLDNFGKKPTGFLPVIKMEGLVLPVIEIIDERNDELVYSIRWNRSEFQAPVFDNATTYTVKVGDPNLEKWEIRKGIRVSEESLLFEF